MNAETHRWQPYNTHTHSRETKHLATIQIEREIANDDISFDDVIQSSTYPTLFFTLSLSLYF